MVREGEVQCVVSNQIHMETLQIGRNTLRVQRSNTGHLVSAGSARAVLPQIAKGVGTNVTVLPGDPELLLPDLL